jgi:hypothetical protein
MLSSLQCMSNNVILTEGDLIDAPNIRNYGYPDAMAPEGTVWISDQWPLEEEGLFWELDQC